MTERDHDFIYEDKELGWLYMKEETEETTSVHALRHDSKPLCSLKSYWWDLSTINKLMDEQRGEIKHKMLTQGIMRAIETLQDALENTIPTLPKYNSARAKVLSEDLLTELKLGLESLIDVLP